MPIGKTGCYAPENMITTHPVSYRQFFVFADMHLPDHIAINPLPVCFLGINFSPLPIYAYRQKQIIVCLRNIIALIINTLQKR
jgi:hypothetical protein